VGRTCTPSVHEFGVCGLLEADTNLLRERDEVNIGYRREEYKPFTSGPSSPSSVSLVSCESATRFMVAGVQRLGLEARGDRTVFSSSTIDHLSKYDNYDTHSITTEYLFTGIPQESVSRLPIRTGGPPGFDSVITSHRTQRTYPYLTPPCIGPPCPPPPSPPARAHHLQQRRTPQKFPTPRCLSSPGVVPSRRMG